MEKLEQPRFEGRLIKIIEVTPSAFQYFRQIFTFNRINVLILA
jgi:hypothetical protein